MAANALLIGPSYTDLRGVAEDVRLMTDLLQGKGFQVTECAGPSATRAGILAAYEALIDATRPGDAVVVYYSGHGSVADAPEPTQLDLQYIVPTDCVPSSEDFRGIASVELSILLARLTDITHNVTVILDCCHAGLMSRDDRMRRKWTAPVEYGRLKFHLDRLIEAGLPVAKWSTEGNPHAVRMTACTTRQVAYEYDGSAGKRVGLFTESLATALGQAGDTPVTWADVMDRVRQRIIDVSYDQRPAVEGPADRLLFSEETQQLLTALPVRLTRDGDILRLECAPLLAVQLGDEFAVMPAGATGVNEQNRIGRLVVTQLGPLWADGQLTLAPGRRPDPEALVGARAFRTVMAAPRLPVRVSTADPRAAEIVAALENAPMARLAAPSDTEWLAEVRVGSDGALTLCDERGPLHSPRPAGAAGVAQVMEGLQILARSAQLRRLAGSMSLRARISIEWGRVVDGWPDPLEAGATLSAGDLLYVQVHNGESNREVFVSIIDIGLTGKISVVTGQVGGWTVRPGGEYTLGRDQRSGVLSGNRLSWPAGLALAQARPETLLVFVMSEPQDLRAVEQPGIRYRSKGGGVSPLLGLLNQVRTGQLRDLTPERAEDFGYDVHEIRFSLRP